MFVSANTKLGPTILDDGLQDKKINYDISIACFNSCGIGNEFLLPAGPLREKINKIKNCNFIF